MNDAQYTLRIADHMLTITYPMVKDPKMLLGILASIQKAHDALITSIIDEKPLSKTFLGKLQVAKKSLLPEEIRHLEHIHSLIEDHKQSSIEFSRRQSFVIANETYTLRTLTNEDLKKYMVLSKKLLRRLGEQYDRTA